MRIFLEDNDHDFFTNMRFADEVPICYTKEQLQKMLCDFKHSTEKVGLKTHPGKTKILSIDQSSSIKVEILTKEESTKYLGQMITIPATGDDRDQESY